jgi:hypothetical protein
VPLGAALDEQNSGLPIHADFFFHIRHGGSLAEDPDGTDLPTLAPAYAEAVAMARELAAADLRANKPVRNLSIEITDAVGQIQTTLSVRAIINNIGLTLEEASAHATEFHVIPHMTIKEQKLRGEALTDPLIFDSEATIAEVAVTTGDRI